MSKKMLIDATHPEETRVVVVDGTKVEEFDFESINKRQLAGNIYLAKVTRVEPSLQAAFVEYGGNRHGFLAFSEIHPDYYQIPVADREALLAAEEAEHAAEGEEEERRTERTPRNRNRRRRGGGSQAATAASGLEIIDTGEPAEDEAAVTEATASAAETDPRDAPEPADETAASGPDVSEPAAEIEPEGSGDDTSRPGSIAESAGTDDGESVSEDFSAPEPAAEGEAEPAPAKPKRPRRSRKKAEPAAKAEAAVEATAAEPAPAPEPAPEPVAAQPETSAPVAAQPEPGADAAPAVAEAETARTTEATPDGDEGAEDRAEDSPEDRIESVGAESVEDEVRPRRVRMRSYKIQEVIKVRQIMLVQVVKEERGNKGAALTTYLSLAGRYCVLMPNTARGGGISRKITSADDRKKLKEIAAEFEVPKGMGLIIRTAGAQRTKAEIKRDYEFLLRQWDQIRELTLKSIAPTLIYEEGSLIKRSIRDLYMKDIDEILVEGEEGYREAKDYMRMLMPSHAKAVQPYRETTPLFIRYQVESYLASMFNPVVQLKSGGYIVIGVTEALVAIDVNSGRSTREGSIEDTALKTNLEAADEVARQLRLRDLAGLIVIDFIDMDERRNNAAVEKRMKDRLKHDRARIQMGRISGFGLMELSRQRLRPGMLEASTSPCPHCHGTGLIRSPGSLALSILRDVEEEGVRKRSREVKVSAPVTVANFLINQKREHIAAIELRYGLSVLIEADPTLVSPEYRVEKLKTASRPLPSPATAAISAEKAFPGLDDALEDTEDDEADASTTAAPAEARSDSRDDPRDENGGKPKRRRGKRGGRKRRRTDGADDSSMRVIDAEGDDDAAPMPVARSAFGDEIGLEADEAPAAESAPADVPVTAAEAAVNPELVAPEPEPVQPEPAARAQEPAAARPEPAAEPVPAEPVLAETIDVAPKAEPEPERPRRSGWWSFGAR